MRYWALCLPLALAVLINAQTRTTVVAGQTVVIAVTNVPGAGGNPVPTTSTIRTIREADVNDGPIAGAPPNTNGPAPPTTYYQTSFNANGEPVATQTFEFTPTFAPTSAAATYPSGTIFNYSSYTSKYATATYLPNSAGPVLDRRRTIGLASVVAGVTGAFVVLL